MLEAEEKLAATELAFDQTHSELTQTQETLEQEQAKTAPKRGRPVGHRGAAMLSEQWDSYSQDARRQAFWRHCLVRHQSRSGDRGHR